MGLNTEALEEVTKFQVASMVTTSEYHSVAPIRETFKLGVSVEQEWIFLPWKAEGETGETP